MRKQVAEEDFDGGAEPFVLPVDGILDLHPFDPKEVKDVVAEYLCECRGKGILDVKIIHGKGTGALRRTVQSLLSRMPEVVSFDTAGLGDGGWGSTFVTLAPPGENAKEI